MKCPISILAIVCPLLMMAQPPGKALSVGDAVPDLALTPMVNHTASTYRLSEARGKLLILDFWATWCTSCLYGFPKLQALQEQFAGQLQVLLVNASPELDDEAKVKAFFQKRKQKDGSLYTLPSVVGDTVLSTLFPCKLIPHYVWIKEGRVVAITGSEEVSADNISAVLSGNTPDLRVKRDVLDFDGDKSLIREVSRDQWEAVRYSSLITGPLDGLPGSAGHKRDSARGTVRQFFTNHSLLQLIRYAYRANLPDSRVLLEVAHPERLKTPAEGEWRKPGLIWCYELTLPLEREGELHRLMQGDIERYFGYRPSLEKRPLKCLVIRAAEKGVRGKSPGQKERKEKEAPVGGDQKTYASLGHLATVLSHKLPWPVVNEVAAGAPITLPRELPQSLSELFALLRPHGLTLEEELREVEVLVIREERKDPG